MTAMGKHVTSIGIGTATAIAGLVLWLTTEGVHVPVISLHKTGLVLAVLGLIEVIVSGVALINPRTRHRDYDL